MLLPRHRADFAVDQVRCSRQDPGRVLVRPVGRPHGESRYLRFRQARIAQSRHILGLLEACLAVLRNSLAVQFVRSLVLGTNQLPVVAAELADKMALGQVVEVGRGLTCASRVNRDRI